MSQSKAKRILWLINHKTLMKAEVPLLEGLGYEVFVPKIIPAAGFRSGCVDFAYDRGLSLPTSDLEHLNAFDFYGSEWTLDIERIINTHFGIAFVRPYTRLKLLQCLRRFAGHVTFRAFGNENGGCYSRTLGREVIDLIAARGSRFSFAAGYRQVAGAEAEFLKRRSVYFPIGLDDGFRIHADTWTGARKCFLAIIPDILSGHMAAAAYRDLKEHMGHIPHIIAGAQLIPVDDPSVIGFVTDSELLGLYRNCAAFFSPSRNFRHILYSPIEAAIVGQPIVCYAESLLGQFIGNPAWGCAADAGEAASLLSRLVEGDSDTARGMILGQKQFLEGFSAEACRRAYAPALELMLVSAESGAERIIPIAPCDLVNLLPEEIGEPAAPDEWIDFAAPKWPQSIRGIFGISWADDWGRWSEGDHIVIEFARPLPRHARVTLVAGTNDENADRPFAVRAGAASASSRLTAWPWHRRQVQIELEIEAGISILEIEIPHPTPTPNGRLIGLGICQLRVENRAPPETRNPEGKAPPISQKRKWWSIGGMGKGG